MTITLSLVAPEPFVVLNLSSVFSLLWFTNLAPTEALSPPSLRKYKAALLLSVVPVFKYRGYTHKRIKEIKREGD